MSAPLQRSFDSVALRFRGDRCAASSVAPPFRTVYWPDVGVIASALGLPAGVGAGNREAKMRFLMRLGERLALGRSFRPANIGFSEQPQDIRRREAFRRRYRLVTLVGPCTREVMLGTLDAVMSRIERDGTVDVQFKGWDALRAWSVGRECIRDVANYLYVTRQCRGSITLSSELRTEVDSGFWEFVYDHPRVRIAWLAVDLLACGDMDRFRDYCHDSVPFKNLQRLSDSGVWPHLVLPVSEVNVEILPELVEALIGVTRGGSIEIAPVNLMPEDIASGAPLGVRSGGEVENVEAEMNAGIAAPPPVDDYTEALLAIYRNPRMPLRLVTPLAWVAARVDSQVPMLSSPAAAGAELAVLTNGDVYASEWAVGLERWHLGNILRDGSNLKWERLDIMPEAFGNSAKPEACQQCDWRYRCGGVDPSISLLKERRQSVMLNEWFYCTPRKALFEEVLWGSVEAAAQGQGRNGRERIELQPDGITFAPAATKAKKP